jgi:hypothetical protein
LYSKPVVKSTGVLCDQIITLQGFYARKSYPDKLRRIKYYDAEKNKTLVFITNNFILPALTIADIYRCRWQVELFFKWIKQHLRIKAFYGTSVKEVGKETGQKVYTAETRQTQRAKQLNMGCVPNFTIRRCVKLRRNIIRKSAKPDKQK